ncbi:MAG TPA: monofunctional biosynthetic peptidoglycan transglycosylase [Bacteroidales bacterium]|nr:monofunctional biosynthetic peptidoglycan transglycosylase [Bacteroidales bacterium]
MQKKIRNKIKKFLKILFLYIPVAFIAVSLLSVIAFKWLPVYYTPLMFIRSIENIDDKDYKTYKKWVPIEKISPNLQLAVMASEDNRFLQHHGFDWEAINKVIEMNKRSKKLRGASTISQQTAKNVFLIPSRTWVRKGFEAYFTVCIELIWGKERIMEVYLNVAEMGKGIFGAEAAAEQLFHKTAQKLTERESALIAASLPNPVRRKANNPSPYVSSRAAQIQSLMYMMERPWWFDKYRKSK